VVEKETTVEGSKDAKGQNSPPMKQAMDEGGRCQQKVDSEWSTATVNSDG